MHACMHVRSVNQTLLNGKSSLPGILSTQDGDRDLYSRINEGLASTEYKFCGKCKNDTYFCRHKEEFSNSDPRANYSKPVCSFVAPCLLSSFFNYLPL